MKITPKKDLEEFVGADGEVIGGDRNARNDSEIETGPVQKPWNDDSEYEKGMSTTTDRATRYRQNIPWFAVYSYRSSSGRGLPINEKKSEPHDPEEDKTDAHPTGSSDWRKSKVKTKKQLEEEIMEDLVKKSKKDRDMWEKNYDGKVEKILDNISDGEFSEEQLKKLKKAVLDKIKEKNG